MFMDYLLYYFLRLFLSGQFHQFMIIFNFIARKNQGYDFLIFPSDMVIVFGMRPKTAQTKAAVFFIPVFTMLACP